MDKNGIGKRWRLDSPTNDAELARTQGWLNPQKLRERFAEEEEPLPSWWHDEVPGSKIVCQHLSGEGC